MQAAKWRLGLWWLALAMMLSASTAAAPRWRKAETPHFEVYSSASKAETREIIRDLELFHQTLLEVFSLKPQAERRTRIVIFARERHLEPYKPDLDAAPPDDSLAYQVSRKKFTPVGARMLDTPKPVRLTRSWAEMHAEEMNARRVALTPPRSVSRVPPPDDPDAQHAYSLNHPDETLIVLSGEDEWDQTKSVLFGRYTVAMLQQCGLTEPRWFLEGMAELLATFEIRRETAVIGRGSEPLLTFMQGLGYFMPWEEFFAVAADSRAYRQLGNRDVFAAQAWLLMHYCYFSEERSVEWRAALLAWIADVQRGEGDMMELLQRHLGVTPDELTAELQAYLYRQKFTGLVTARPATWPGQQVDLQRAEKEARDEALLDVRLRLARDEDAVRELEARVAAEGGEDDVAALEQLGVAAMMRGEVAAQADYWERARVAGSTDPAVVRFATVEALRERVERAELGEWIADEQAVVWRGILEDALRLDPNNEITLQWLGWLEALAQTPSVPNMNKVQRAVSAGMAQPDDVLMAVAIMQARGGDQDTARDIVTRFDEGWERWKWRGIVERLKPALDPAVRLIGPWPMGRPQSESRDGVVRL